MECQAISAPQKPAEKLAIELHRHVWPDTRLFRQTATTAPNTSVNRKRLSTLRLLNLQPFPLTIPASKCVYFRADFNPRRLETADERKKPVIAWRWVLACNHGPLKGRLEMDAFWVLGNREVQASDSPH